MSHASDNHGGDAHGCDKCQSEMDDVGYQGECTNTRGCFPFSAPVTTPSGKVPIGEILKDQEIFSYRHGVLVPRLVTHKLIHGFAPLVRVEFISGKAFQCVSVHSFLTTRGWLSLKKCRPGDSIIQASTHGIDQDCIKSITQTGAKEIVFNLHTQGEHNFIVNNCVAHNFTYFRELRTIFHRTFLDGLTDEHLPSCAKRSLR